MSSRKNLPDIDPRFACFALCVGHSGIHRLGVYAAEDIPANRKVIEYTGEKISRRETKRRVGRRLNYIFTLDNYWSIDGGVGGSGAELINHCCEPNLTTQIRSGHNPVLQQPQNPQRRGAVGGLLLLFRGPDRALQVRSEELPRDHQPLAMSR